MKISAGELDRRIKLYTADLSSFTSIYAYISPITAREQLQNGLEVINDEYRIKIRYRANVSCANYLYFDDCYYNIIACEANKRDGYIFLTVSLDAQKSDKPYTETD